MKQELYDKLVSYIIENQDKFYRLAFSYVKNQDDALDVVQNAVCKALSHYTDLRNENAIKTWIYRIARNCSGSKNEFKHCKNKIISWLKNIENCC